MKKVFLYAAICLFGLASCMNNEVKNEVSNQTTDETVQTEDPYSSIALGNKYYSTFENGDSRGSDYQNYPDYLGGTYHDSIGNLVFLIKGDMEVAKKDIRQRIGNAPNLRFEPCTYSLRELKELSDKLGEQFENADLRKEFGWTSIAISVVENRVYVFFKECTDSVITKFKKTISDSEMIRFDKLIMEPLSIQADSVRTDSRATSINIPV